MIFGSPFGAGFGDPSNSVAYFEAVPKNGGATIGCRLTPRPSGLSSLWGNAYWQFYRNAKLFTVKYIADGIISPRIDIPNDPNSTTTSILALRVGALADPLFDCSNVARTFETATSPRYTIKWQWTPECLGSPDGGNYTSSWTATKVTYAMCRRSIVRQTWSTLDYDLAYSGGNVTVTVRNGNSGTIAQGTGAVGGSITVANVDGSGAAFTVTVSAGTNNSGTLNFRWPASMSIKRGVSDPPSTVIATISFNFSDYCTWTEASDVAAGTYYYRITPNTDTGEPGVDSPSYTTVIPGAPQPPTSFAYSSGNAGAPVLTFKASTTPGATYRLYIQKIGQGFFNFNQTPVTAGPFTPGSTQTINAAAVTGYAGSAYYILRAVNGSTEEQNVNMVGVEFDGTGVYVPPRPNTPNILDGTVAVTAGRTLNAYASYNSIGELGVATQLKLYIRTPSGSASSVYTATLGPAVDSIKRALLTYTLPADGYYYISASALTAAGAESLNRSAESLIYVSNETTFANANPYLTQLSRG